jgi:hypothetical protein
MTCVKLDRRDEAERDDQRQQSTSLYDTLNEAGLRRGLSPSETGLST